MEKNWVKIFESTDEPQVEIARQVLQENGIDAVFMDKKDQSFLIGMAELYVSGERLEEAKIILKEFIGE